MIKKKKILLLSLAVIFSVVSQRPVLAEEATLLISPVVIQSGHSFIVPVNIDQVENLAGIKLVLQYDSTVLKYEKTEKSEKTSQLMQVVNDKKPGKLIVVMAGAKGVSGTEMELLSLHFKTPASLKEKIVSKIQIVDIELVSDQLKTIPCKLSDAEIMILPEMN